MAKSSAWKLLAFSTALALPLILGSCATSDTPELTDTPTAEPTTATPTPSPTPTPTGVEVTINISGDLLWHEPLIESAFAEGAEKGLATPDFTEQLAPLKNYISKASLGICHNETTYAPPGGPYTGYPTFSAPEEIAPAIAATGWDMCTTASNHSLDKGFDGLVRTIDVLNNNGIVPVGTFATPEAAQSPIIYTTKEGVKVGIVSQTYGLNGIPKPAGKEWSVQLLDAESAIAQAAAARAAGADIVAVHMHAGTEYQHVENAEQRAFAEAVAQSEDVDFIFGQHAHFTQPIDKINGKWVVFGTGNLMAQQESQQPFTSDGYLAQITFHGKPGERFEATKMEWAATMVDGYTGGDDYARVYIISEKIGAADPELAARLTASWDRTTEVVNSYAPAGLTQYSPGA